METTATAEEAKVPSANEDVVVAENVPEVPSFTIQADSAFGIRCMIGVRDLAIQLLPRDEQRLIAQKLREFDLYEEMTRDRARVTL